MKKVLIIGKRSFIGSNLKKYLLKIYDINIIDFNEAYKKTNEYFNSYSHIINTSIHKSYVKKKIQYEI